MNLEKTQSGKTMYWDQCCCVDCGCKGNIRNPLDKRLLAWNHHQNMRTQMRAKLAHNTNRSQSNLLMDTNEPHRAIQHHRQVLTYAKVPCAFDKYRGNPAFWKIPTQLHKICDEPQNYFTQLSDFERNKKRTLEYVGVPNLITPQTKRKFASNLTKCDSYCLRRADSCTLGLLLSHKPDIHSLYIKGRGLLTETEIQESESIKGDNKTVKNAIETIQDDTMELRNTRTAPSENYLLRINNVQLPANARDVITCNIIIETSVNRTEMFYIYLENCSKVTLRTSFKDHILESRFSDSRSRKETPKFFYNRNCQILPYGETIAVPFWFRCTYNGFFSTTLQLLVVPDLWDGKLTILLHLKGISSEETLNCLDAYETRIQNGVHKRHVEELLGDVIQEASRQGSDIKLFSYNKAMIFEAINASFDPFHEQPKYEYRKKVVDELEDFYENIRLPCHPDVWSLNLDDLRRATKAREDFVRKKSLEGSLENILRAIDRNKETRRIAMEHVEKLFHEKDDIKVQTDLTPLNAEKGKAKPNVIGQPIKEKMEHKRVEPTRPIRPITLSEHLELIINKLERPRFRKNIKSIIYHSCYSLLCAYIDKACEEIDNAFGLSPFKVKSSQYEYRRPQVGRMPSAINLTCVVDEPTFMDTLIPKDQYPQPDCAKDLPLLDYKTRFHLCLKGTNVENETKKIKITLSIPLKKPVSACAIEESGRSTLTPQNGEDSEDVNFRISWNRRVLYKNNLYLIFYLNLASFVDDFQAVAETLMKRELPYGVIGRMKQSYPRYQSDEGYTIEVINLKQKISEVLKWDVLEDRIEPVRKEVLHQDEIPDEALIRSTSVWKLLESYYPPKFRMAPLKEGDAYAVMPKAMAEQACKSTDITPEETLTERSIQTSWCGDINVVSETSPTLIPEPVCLCKMDDTKMPPLSSSYYCESSSETTTDDDDDDD